MLAVLFAACEKKNDSKFTDGKKIETISATEITSSGALLTGQIGVEIADYKSVEFGMLISEKESDLSSYAGKKLTGDKLLGQTFSITANGLSAETHYYYRAYLVLNAMQYEYGEVKSFKTEKGGTGGNHQYVDLGLPSGLKWATCNVGATTPEGYGDYFAWGETSPKTTYNGITYFDTKNDGTSFIKYNNNGGKTTLDPEDDAAHVNWGGNWRMPTIAEIQELKDNCTWTWKSNYNSTGVAGYIVTSTRNSNSIFLPASGCRNFSSLDDVGSVGLYWSSSLYGDYSDDAYCLFFYSDDENWTSDTRYYGLSVRPVCQ